MSPDLASEPKKQHDPITIRWDMNDGDGKIAATLCAKLNLPIVPWAGDQSSLERLVQHCQPATFGRGGKDVYDESYRRAGKMDPTAFCTTFDPYSTGIIDTVAQVLLPSVYDSVTHRGVRAELYKLNVYSGPSGKFKPHVDTPRSRGQFGSLVVCLPVEHEGGQLKVRHKGEETTFDWSTTTPSKTDGKKGEPHTNTAVQWAAFYSDCEHEVLEVTRGHRITLTYNLFAVRGSGRMTGHSLSPNPLNPTHLPLFDTIQRTLFQDPFNGQGGTIGVWCSHAYAHNHKTESPLPDALKGLDAVLWEIFQYLNLDPQIKPVLKIAEHLYGSFAEWYEDHPEHDGPDPDPDAKERGIWGDDELGLLLPKAMPPPGWVVGHKFGKPDLDNDQLEELWQFHYLYTRFGEYATEPIHWLTEAPGRGSCRWRIPRTATKQLRRHSTLIALFW
ncbi:hypothetical protein PG985_001921 [Apiospora marii]|uniref:uncharacterized protein n=1 Tax=Apiospora marii TaxID=335849 RepID=UPI0031300D75